MTFPAEKSLLFVREIWQEELEILPRIWVLLLPYLSIKWIEDAFSNLWLNACGSGIDKLIYISGRHFIIRLIALDAIRDASKWLNFTFLTISQNSPWILPEVLESFYFLRMNSSSKFRSIKVPRVVFALRLPAKAPLPPPYGKLSISTWSELD